MGVNCLYTLHRSLSVHANLGIFIVNKQLYYNSHRKIAALVFKSYNQKYDFIFNAIASFVSIDAIDRVYRLCAKLSTDFVETEFT